MRKIYAIFSVCLFSLFAYTSVGQNCEYDQSSLLFNLDECKAIFGFPSQTEYDEFTAIPDTFPGGTILSVVGDHLYRDNGAVNMHSCTESYDTTVAMCVGSLDNCNYVAGSDKAVKFDIKVELGNDGVGRLSGLSFYEAGIPTFSWLNGTSGPNNHPTKYALRVLVEGSTIFEEIDIETTPEFSLETFDFSDIPAFRVTEMTVFNFELLPYCLVGIDSPVNAWDLDNIVVTANAVDNVDGGALTFGDGASSKEICVGDGNDDNMNISLAETTGTTNKYLITDAAGVILDYDVTFPYNFEGAGDGTCLIWNISYYGSITGTEIGANASDITGCFDLSNSITLIRNEVGGGTIAGGPFEFCVGDGTTDNIDAGAITLTDNVGANGTWVVTDDQGNILGLPSNYTDVDFDVAGTGTCLIWYLSYEDGLTGAVVGANAAELQGCFDLSNPIEVIRNERPNVSLAPTATVCGDDNGSAIASGSDGLAPYTYTWSNGESGSSVSDLAPGNYTVTITDVKGCTNTGSTIIEDSVSPTASTSSTNTTCGDNNGSATVSATNGTAPYSYAWSNGMSGETIDGLANGEYIVTVTDANGCTGTSTTTVDPSTAPEVSLSGDDTSCGEDNGTASATTAGGQSPYTYIWSTGSTNANLSGLASGNYRVTVTDAAGCTDWEAIDIDDSTSPSASTTAAATRCGEDNGTVSVSVTSGTSPYTYEWSNGSTAEAIEELAAGTYTVTVTDSEGCTSTSSASVEDSNSPSVSISATGTSCGTSNGTASASVNNGTSPFTYEWSNGSSSASLDNLSAGDYSVTVTDAIGCTATSTTTIEESSNNTASAISTDTSCGEDNGTATASAMDGTAPYTYAWSNGEATASISGLAAGSYTVTVTDAAGCTASASTSVSESSSPMAFTSAMPTTCGSANGSATVTATGGVAPYTYAWSNNASNEGESCGNCIQTVMVPVGGLDPIVVEEVIVDGSVLALPNYPYDLQDQTQAALFLSDCLLLGYDVEEDFDQATGIVSISVLYPGQDFESFNINGGEEFTFTCSDCLLQDGSANASITALEAGSYTVTVTDANGCTAESTATVDDSSSPSVTATGSGTTCGSANGNVSVTAIEGTAPYTYAWSNGSTDAMQSGLSTGDYSVTVTDAEGCTGEAIASIVESNPISANTSSSNTTCEEDNGTATVEGANGTAPYTYEWFNGSTSNMVSGLIAGTYSVTVTDAIGCTAEGSATIEDSSSPTVTTDNIDTTCGADNGSANASATGGTAPYTFTWSNGSTDQSISGLSAGTYTVTVTDAVGCMAQGSTTVGESLNVNADASATETTCGMNNGMATVDAINGTEPYTYLWSTAATTQMIMGLEPGDYMVTVSDANGCTDEASVLVEDSEMPSAVAVATPTECGEDTGTVSLGVFGGIEPYTYEWSNGSTENMITGLSAGSYSITLTDAAGCTVSRTATVEDSSSPTVSTDSEHTTCGEDNGEITTSISGGVAPYIYAWSNGSTDVALSNLSAGNYSVTITDAAGCTDMATVTIGDSANVNVDASATDTSCGENNGSGTASATGGEAPYTYVWSSADTDTMIDGLEPGTYDVTVTDANGCTDVASITVGDSSGPELSISSNTTMCGGNNGGATAMVTSGTAPYTYEWSNGSTSTFIGGLVAGNYSVTVTDAAGCTTEGTTTIQDSNAPMVSLEKTNTTCGEDNGSVNASVAGGVAPYTYAWSNGGEEASQSGLAAGDYSLTVTDASGCSAEVTSTVGASANVNADASATETTCGENNGMATVDAVGGVEPYTYLWSTAATTQMIMGLEPGDYMVTVTDATGCTDAASVLVESSSNPSIAIGAAPENCGMMDGAVTVSIPTSGTPPYTVLWSNGSTEETQTGISGGTYSVTVTDANGCTASASIVVDGGIAPDGGEISVAGETSVEFCQEGTMDMLGGLSLDDEVGSNMTWIIANESGVILHLLDDNGISNFDFEDQDPGMCLVYHLSYEDAMNITVGNNVSAISGCFDLSNSVTITKYEITDNSESSLVIDMDMCGANGTTNEPYDYSEFTADINNDANCATLSVVGGNLYRDNPDTNLHSCTEGVDGSVAMCVSSDPDCSYSPDSDRAIKLEIQVEPATSGSTRLTELSFFEKAPEVYDWLDGNAGPNNYPTKFGVRILKGSSVVFQQSDITTLRDWNQRSFTLTGEEFLVTETTTFTVELLAYCIINNGFETTAWDIDDLSLITECENIIEAGTLSGGPYDICRDGLPDFITDVTLEGAEGDLVKLVLVDEEDNVIVANFDNLTEFSSFDFESLPDGVCNLYAISAGTGFSGCEVGNMLKSDFEGCYKLSNAITITKLACGTVIGTYPNPTNSFVTISNIHTMEGEKTISIYDAMGKQVRTYKVSGDIVNDDVDLSDYNPGLYVIQIIATSGKKTTKSVLKVK